MLSILNTNVSETRQESISRPQLYGLDDMNAWTISVIRVGARNLVRLL